MLTFANLRIAFVSSSSKDPIKSPRLTGTGAASTFRDVTWSLGPHIRMQIAGILDTMIKAPSF